MFNTQPDTNFVELTYDQFFTLLATSPCKLRKSWMGNTGKREPIWSLHEPTDTVLGTPAEGLPVIALRCDAAYTEFFANKAFWAAYGLDLPDALAKPVPAGTYQVTCTAPDKFTTNQEEKVCDNQQ